MQYGLYAKNLGNSGANLSWLEMVDSKIIYVHTANESDTEKFQGFLDNVIPLLAKLLYAIA